MSKNPLRALRFLKRIIIFTSYKDFCINSPAFMNCHSIYMLSLLASRQRLARECEGECDVKVVQEERVRVMDSTNPRVVLRNYIAQNAIEAAENGDFSEVKLLPYSVLPDQY